MIDQASKLRTMIGGKSLEVQIKEEGKAVKIYSVVSGKGGVGKTNFSINLAIKLQQMGKRVLILEADIGMSNANILLGIDSSMTISDLINHGAELKDVIIKGPEGVDLLSGGADLLLMESLDDDRQKYILESLNDLGIYDIIIIEA